MGCREVAVILNLSPGYGGKGGKIEIGGMCKAKGSPLFPLF